MQKPHSTYAAAFLAAALSLCGCDSGSGTDGGSGLPENASSADSYTVVGNTIITPLHEDTSYACAGSESDTSIDKSGPDTAEFLISGNTLTLYADLDTVGSGAVNQKASTFTRVGAGTGLEGTWNMTDQGYRSVSGTMTTDEKAQLDSDLAAARRNYQVFVKLSVTFSGGRLITFVDADMAALFIENWNGTDPLNTRTADSSKFDMTAKAIDRTTLEFKGRKTGETVRVTIKPIAENLTGDMTYSSDQPAHSPFHYLASSRTCPNPAQPDWYLEFQSANKKGPGSKAKSGQIHPKPTFSIRIPLIPLKSAYSFLN